MVRRIDSLLGYIEERLEERAIGRGPEHQFHCPFCIDRTGSDSRKRKFGINIVTAQGGCYRCEYGFRTWEKFFKDLNGGYIRIEEIQLLRFQPPMPTESVLAAVEGVFKDDEEAADVDKENARPLKAHHLPRECRVLADLPLSSRSGVAYGPAFRYLAKRGATEHDIRRFQIGYCSTGDWTRYLIFPVIQGGKLVYFTSRWAGDSPPLDMKSKNLENEDGYHSRGTCLLNYDACFGVERIALVEGAFSAMAYEHAVASLGKHLSERQVLLFRKLVKAGLREVVISLDPDAGREMEAAYGLLRPVVPEVTCLTLDWGDPWDRRAELPTLLDTRLPLDQVSLATRLAQRLGRN